MIDLSAVVSETSILGCATCDRPRHAPRAILDLLQRMIGLEFIRVNSKWRPPGAPTTGVHLGVNFRDYARSGVERLRRRGAQLVGEVVQYKNAYRLCYIRGPGGLLIGLAQELS